MRHTVARPRVVLEARYLAVTRMVCLIMGISCCKRADEVEEEWVARCQDQAAARRGKARQGSDDLVGWSFRSYTTLRSHEAVKGREATLFSLSSLVLPSYSDQSLDPSTRVASSACHVSSRSTENHPEDSPNGQDSRSITLPVHRQAFPHALPFCNLQKQEALIGTSATFIFSSTSFPI